MHIQINKEQFNESSILSIITDIHKKTLSEAESANALSQYILAVTSIAMSKAMGYNNITDISDKIIQSSQGLSEAKIMRMMITLFSLMTRDDLCAITITQGDDGEGEFIVTPLHE